MPPPQHPKSIPAAPLPVSPTKDAGPAARVLPRQTVLRTSHVLETAMASIRKPKGNFLEDFQAGQVFRHKVGKTVTEGLFNAFTEFTMTTNPLPKNRRYEIGRA